MRYLAKKQARPLEIAIASAIAMSSLGAGVAFAQDQSRQLEEILVTTERRLASEQTTAISIEVFTPDDLASQQINDIVDLQNAVPGLQFFQNGSYVQANVRGVGNPSRGGPSEQVGVPVFFDGATQGEEMSLASGFFDIGDVQVLRGPQATFVGQAAAGGAILINSARPNFEGVNGHAELTIGEYNRTKIEGALNLPIADDFAARISYMSEERDSFFTNFGANDSTGGESNVPGDQVDQNFRLTTLWEPSNSFSLFTKFERTHLESHGTPQQPNPNSYTGAFDHDNDINTPPLSVTSYGQHSLGPAPGTGTPFDHDSDPLTPDAIRNGTPGPGGVLYDPADPWAIDIPVDQYRRQTNNRISFEPIWTLDSGLTVRVLSSFIQMDRLEAQNADLDSQVADRLTGFHLGPDMLTYSHEFNLISPEGQRLEWLVGLYRNSRHTELSLNIPLDNPGCGWQFDGSWIPCSQEDLGIGASNLRLYWTSTDDVDHNAVFGQINFDLTDELELVFEGRFNQDDNVQVRQINVTPFTVEGGGGPPGFAQCPGQADRNTFLCPPGTGEVGTVAPPFLVWPVAGEDGEQATYKVGVNWEPADGHFIYAFVARGYKSGQTAPLDSDPVVAEIVDDIELGWKGTVLDGKLYAELGIYSMNYENMQMSAFRPGTSESSFGATNIGDSTIEGFEGAIQFYAGGFGLSGSFNVSNSELGAITTVDQNSLPLALPAGPGNTFPGATSRGCTPANAGAFGCFDYGPYLFTVQGAENLFSPELSYNFTVDYAIQLANGGTLTPAVSFNHADTAYSSILQRPADRFYTMDERDLVNVNLTYEKDDWTVQLFSTNVTNELFIEGHSNTGQSILYGDPEVWGIRARMDF
jgi:iron complex outermembrane receptor protein